MIRSLNSFDLKDKRVLIRVDYNVPIEDGVVKDAYRIQCSIPTIKECLESGASVVLMSHLGRPKGKINEAYSLISVGEVLSDFLEIPIKFSHDCISEDAINVTIGLYPGEVHLLENLRFHNAEIIDGSFKRTIFVDYADFSNADLQGTLFDGIDIIGNIVFNCKNNQICN